MENEATLTIPCFPIFIVFLVLKLTKVIAWSWWWVCSPLWIPFAIVLIILFIAMIVTALS
jgi:hypothetical protein